MLSEERDLRAFAGSEGNDTPELWHLDYGSSRPLESLASAVPISLPQLMFLVRK